MSRDPLAVLRDAARGHDHAPLFKAQIVEAIAQVEALVLAANCPHANIISRMTGPGYVDVPPDDWNRLRAALRPFTPGQDSEGVGHG